MTDNDDDPLKDEGPMLVSLCDVFDTTLTVLRSEASPFLSPDEPLIPSFNVRLSRVLDDAEAAIQRLRQHTEGIEEVVSTEGIEYWEKEIRRLWERVLTYLSWTQFEIAIRRKLADPDLSLAQPLT